MNSGPWSGSDAPKYRFETQLGAQDAALFLIAQEVSESIIKLPAMAWFFGAVTLLTAPALIALAALYLASGAFGSDGWRLLLGGMSIVGWIILSIVGAILLVICMLVWNAICQRQVVRHGIDHHSASPEKAVLVLYPDRLEMMGAAAQVTMKWSLVQSCVQHEDGFVLYFKGLMVILLPRRVMGDQAEAVRRDVLSWIPETARPKDPAQDLDAFL